MVSIEFNPCAEHLVHRTLSKVTGGEEDVECIKECESQRRTSNISTLFPLLVVVPCAVHALVRDGLCGWGNDEQQTYTQDSHRVVDGALWITVRFCCSLMKINV